MVSRRERILPEGFVPGLLGLGSKQLLVDRVLLQTEHHALLKVLKEEDLERIVPANAVR